jgi:CheY-like chemotaxis protein
VPHVEGVLPSVTGDHRRLLQVLGNVLTNAVKFTPEGGTVEVGCARTDGWLDIHVRDSGAGIDPAFLPHVFDRFRQGDSRATRRHGGLGLGLAIARHLVEQHGGEIRASSDGPGRGTTVSIRLPAASAPRAGRRADRQGADLRLDQTAILVVDDHEDSREMLAQLLEHAGARVVQSESALTALDLIAAGSVQVLIADIAMPDVDGYELIRRVRARGVSLPAIALTAFARPEDRERALSAGYSEYCAKPIDGRELVRTIRNVIAQ